MATGKFKLLIIHPSKPEAQKTASKLSEFFSENACIISCMNTSEDALEVIKKDPPCVILLDYYLPGVEGDEFLISIK